MFRQTASVKGVFLIFIFLENSNLGIDCLEKTISENTPSSSPNPSMPIRWFCIMAPATKLVIQAGFDLLPFCSINTPVFTLSFWERNKSKEKNKWENPCKLKCYLRSHRKINIDFLWLLPPA